MYKNPSYSKRKEKLNFLKEKIFIYVLTNRSLIRRKMLFLKYFRHSINVSPETTLPNLMNHSRMIFSKRKKKMYKIFVYLLYNEGENIYVSLRRTSNNYISNKNTFISKLEKNLYGIAYRFYFVVYNKVSS